jgi:nitroreductase
MRAQTSTPVNEVIATRRSPRSFDESYLLSRDEQLAVLEAARWAASAFNTQPWRFYLGNRGDATFSEILSSLGEFNQMWAQKASTLILVASTTVKADGTPHADYQYDCGLAVGQLVIEAHDRGLIAHQMTGFSKDKARAALGMPDELVPVVVIALGKQDSPEKLSGPLQERELAPRVRLPLEELVLKGLPS